MKTLFKTLSVLLAVIMTLTLVSCGKGGQDETDTAANTAGAVTQDSKPDAVSIDFEEVTEPEFINPLTGLEASYDTAGKRPLSVMLNNISDALPQVGIGDADVIFECLAEGGITRLLAFFSEYKNLGVIGSVRSSRPYYIDFAQMFDAIYCHAGGSEDAYSEMAYRMIDHIDGVRGDPLGVYYRDAQRMQTMAIEHTLMTTGQGLIDTIDYCGFRTDLREGFEMPYTFPEYGEKEDLGGEACRHIHIPISYFQTVDYEYDDKNEVYLRYQYNGQPHIDGADGKQLSFTNVLILFSNTYIYDDYGRLHVDTVGDGSGFLASEGKYIPVTWHRDSADGNLSLTRSDNGAKITLNRGKTFVNVCPLDVQYQIGMNAE